MFWNWFGLWKQTEKAIQQEKQEIPWLLQVNRKELSEIILDTVEDTIGDIEIILNFGTEYAKALSGLIEVSLEVADHLQQKQETSRSLFQETGKSRIIEGPFEHDDIVKNILEHIQDIPK